MRKFISIALIGTLAFSVSYGAIKKVPKGERKIHRFEPAPSEHFVLGQGSSKIVMPKIAISFLFNIFRYVQVSVP